MLFRSQELFREIGKRQPAFLIILGDLTARGSSSKHWEYFDTYSAPIRAQKIPVLPVFGNHDYYGSNKTALGHFFLRFPHLKKKTWYDFVFRNTGFVFFNSNFGDLSEKEKKEQQRWYLERLSRWEKDPEIRFSVVCCHHSPYTNSTVISSSSGVRENYAAPFRKLKKTAFFFSGHCHSFEWFVEGDKNFVVSGGGGGPRQRLNTNKKTRKYNDLFEGPSVRFFHFCELKIDEKGVSATVIEHKKNGFASVLTVPFPPKGK